MNDWLKAVFCFPFRGPNWQGRLLIGGALILAGFAVPIVPWILVYGYVLQVMRQAVEGEELSLPAWEDWGRLAMDGLRYSLVGLAYMGPGMLVFAGGMGLYMVSAFALPFLLAVAEESVAVQVGAPLLFVGSMGVMFLSMFLGTTLTLLGALPLPIAIAHFVRHGQVGAAFRVREWWPLWRVNKLGYFIAWVATLGLFAVLYAAVMIAYMSVVLCCAIPFVTALGGFYLSLVTMALFGQTYRESQELVAGV